MTESSTARPAGRRLQAVALAAICLLALAAVLDLAGTLDAVPRSWPPSTWVISAAGIAIGLLVVLLRMLILPARLRPAARITLLELVAFGLLLGAWLLRGHPEIPPDPPLVAASLLAVGLLALGAWLRTRHDAPAPARGEPGSRR